MRNVVQQSFVGFTIGEKSYTVIYQKYMKENVVSSEISIQNPSCKVCPSDLAMNKN